MKTITELLRERLYKTSYDRDTTSLASLKINRKNCDFRKLMNNRLITGFFRYEVNDPNKQIDYDRINGIIRHINKYNETGNLEHLIDIANLAELEFIKSKHPRKHFKAMDDVNHVQKIKEKK